MLAAPVLQELEEGSKMLEFIRAKRNKKAKEIAAENNSIDLQKTVLTLLS